MPFRVMMVQTGLGNMLIAIKKVIGFFSLVFGMNFMVNSRETGNFIIFLLGPLNGWDSVGKYVDCA